MAQATRDWNANADADSHCNSDVDPIADTHANCDRIIDGNTKSKPFSYVYPKFDSTAYSNTKVEPGTAASTHAAAEVVGQRNSDKTKEY